MNYKKFFLVTLIIALVISALVGIYIFLFGEGTETEDKVLGTTMAVASFSLLAFCSSLHQNRKGFKWFSLLGVITSLIAFFLVILTIWITLEDNGDYWRAALIASVVAFVFAHTSLLFLVKIKSTLAKYTLYSTIFFILVVGGMLINAIICDFAQDEFFFRLLGVFAILDVLGSITLPLLNKLTEKK